MVLQRGNVITGTDVDPVETQGVFADLANLRDALNSNNQTAITAAAEVLPQTAIRTMRPTFAAKPGARDGAGSSRAGRIRSAVSRSPPRR